LVRTRLRLTTNLLVNSNWKTAIPKVLANPGNVTILRAEKGLCQLTFKKNSWSSGVSSERGLGRPNSL
jgi:hypothetical protein